MAYAVGSIPSDKQRITRLEMKWTVGQDARSSYAFYSPWFGMDPADNLNLVQPVNPWGGSSWSMYTEYFQWSPEHNSNSESRSVKAGQTLHGSIVYSEGDDSYTLTQKVVETGATSSQVVKCQNGKKYVLPYIVYEKLTSCKNYPPDGVVTFRDIVAECDGEDCTQQIKWEAKVKDANCNMKAVIHNQTSISITWDPSAASKYDSFSDAELFDLNYHGWATKMNLQRPAEDAAAKINGLGASWKAGKNTLPAEFKSLLGTKLEKSEFPEVQVDPAFKAPASFDARAQWPKCSVIGTIRNQASCGSCWAFGAVEAFEDRRCIVSGEDKLLSAQNLIACDEWDNGCEGGNLGSAWNYLKRTGVPTESCQPYTVPTCPPSQQPCTNFKPTPKCQKTGCYGNGTDSTHYKASKVVSMNSVEQMMQEISTNGPIEVAFTVYTDFEHYKSGVYHHVSGSVAGGHAVKMIGWGEENGTPYWLCVNSWTNQWGDQGLFKIRKGNNECGIEDGATAGTPA
eukprot:TRINITY_DN1227_c0_g1_i1.p2 TRINITY_DN1227_c0_g1~~TRINITY_DN1227_c0_g1_i1.p2  ORF type:complete len:555 (+),score=222.35 TRINITY_DN1227_c0_g1_i1:135-1667(+)